MEYRYSLWRVGDPFASGAVEAMSLADALRMIGRRDDTSLGDQVEIGVRGFPPARYTLIEGNVWGLMNRRAA